MPHPSVPRFLRGVRRSQADGCAARLIRSDNINEIQEPLVMVKDQKWLCFTLES